MFLIVLTNSEIRKGKYMQKQHCWNLRHNVQVLQAENEKKSELPETRFCSVVNLK